MSRLKLDVVSLGEPMIEFCATSVGSLKDVNLFERGWGGDTSNFCVAAARLGYKAGYICRVGGDEFGRCLLDMWSREGVDTSHVLIDEGSFTGIYFIALKNGGEHEFIYYRKDSAASHLSPEDLDPDYIRGAKAFHASGISQAISRSCCESVFKAVQIAKEAGLTISYDPNLRLKLWPINMARAVIYHTFKLADLVMPSLDEALLITKKPTPLEAAKEILKQGPEIVVIKLGADGCLVVTSKESFHSPGFKVKVVDTTGAGDAFDAAFLTGFIEGWELHKVAEFANAAGALTTISLGAVKPIPTRVKVENFLRTLKNVR